MNALLSLDCRFETHILDKKPIVSESGNNLSKKNLHCFKISSNAQFPPAAAVPKTP